jgi:hypothetical protein
MTTITRTITTIIMLISLTACSYNPKIDTVGRSGTFPDTQAERLTNDIQHCRQYADEHTFRIYDTLNQGWGAYFHYATLGIVPKRESKYRQRVDQCLRGRGHSVID